MVFSFGRADPERMPKGKPMNLVTLLCSVDHGEIEGVAGPQKIQKEVKKDELESYAAFKTRLESELKKLLHEKHAERLYYVRINKGKASILLRGVSANPSSTFSTVFKDNKELIVFVKQKAPDLDSGKFKEIFFFLKGETKVISKRVERFYQWFFEDKNYKRVDDLIEDVVDIKALVADMEDNFCSARKKIDQLYSWHDREDDDGVKVWYIRTTLEKSLGQLTDTLEKQNRLIMNQIKRISELERDVQEIKDTLSE